MDKTMAVLKSASLQARSRPRAFAGLGRLSYRLLLWPLLLVAATAGWAAWNFTSATLTHYDYQIVREYPHDPEAYCQGLVYHEGYLIEGTGQYGKSELRRVRLETGEVVQSVVLDEKYFGEGVAVWQDRIYQLTWRERIAFVYNKQTLASTGETFRYAGEGWGLTTDGRYLIMSDGTSVLSFLEPRTFQKVKEIIVRENNKRVRNLNELEYIDGLIYANIWKEDDIVQIDPRTGKVVGRIHLRGLNPKASWYDDHVLNGIAYDAENNRLFVTGKNWPKLYEIRLIPRNR
jgi:glutamine cyclotransferase